MEVHSTTKMRPIDAIKLDLENEKDQNMIDFVIYNTKNSRRNVKNVLEGYEKNDKILIYNHVMKGKEESYLEEVRGKFSEKSIKGYLIPAIENICDTLLEVRICKDSNIVKGQVEKDQIYKIEELFVLQVDTEHCRAQMDLH